ncbi:TPA: hypothetical protein ACKTGI_002757 [Pseudomonas aeruginosa]
MRALTGKEQMEIFSGNDYEKGQLQIRNLDIAQLILDTTEEELAKEALYFLISADNIRFKVDVSEALGLTEQKYFFSIGNHYPTYQDAINSIEYIEIIEKGKYKIKIMLDYGNYEGRRTASVICTKENTEIHFDKEDIFYLEKEIMALEEMESEVFSEISEAEYLKLIYKEKTEIMYEKFKKTNAYDLYNSSVIISLLISRNFISCSNATNDFETYDDISERICRITEMGYDKIQEISKEKINRSKRFYTITDNTE